MRPKSLQVDSAVLGLFCLMLSACSRQLVSADAGGTVKVVVEDAPGPDTVLVDHPERFALASSSVRRLPDTLDVTGVVAPDVSRSVPVVSLSGGRVVEIHARLGDDVEKDQLLLTITSPEVSSAFSDYQKALADASVAQRAFERAQLLGSKGIIAQKDLEAAQGILDKAKVDLTATAARLRILGADVTNPSPIVEIRAPVTGTIVEQNITQGTGVKSLDSSPNLFTIADLSKVWLLCDVFENDLSKVHLGDTGRVHLNAYPGRTFDGRVSNIGRMLDASTRSAKVRLELDNRGLTLRPNMFATVTFISSDVMRRVAVPASAILELHDKSWVFVPLGENRFRRREVEVGVMATGGLREVLAGLKPGDKVVANALELSSAAETRQ